MLVLACQIPRLEAALAEGPLSASCPHIADCPHAGAGCLLFAPGWWCDDREMVVFPDLIRDADEEPDDHD
jgi:hypothetical protein